MQSSRYPVTMFQIIVVDDEPLIARSIAQIIEKTNPAFRVAAIAYDGEAALSKIEHLNPEIVFTDIKMPGMSGLELVKIINQRFPHIKTVILSGYNDFEYAAAALKEGVADYLLKPLQKEILSSFLTKTEKELELLLHSRQLEILNSIINQRELVDASVTGRYFPYRHYCILLTCCGSYFNTQIELPQAISSLCKSNYLYESGWTYIEYNPFWVLNGLMPNEKIMIVACEQEELPAMEKIFHTIYQSFHRLSAPITTVIHSFSDTSLELLPSHLLKMNKVMKENIIFSQSIFISPDHLSATKQTMKFLTTEEQRELSIFFKQHSQQNLQTLISNIFSRMEAGNYKQTELEELLMQMIQIFLESVETSCTPALYRNTISEIISYHFTYSSLQKEFFNMIQELIDIKQLSVRDQVPKNITAKAVREYIEQNYTTPINIQTLAAMYGIVAPYLSKIYYEYYGHTIKADIIGLRMKKAKELLKLKPPLPLREIADLSGFNDQFYFSKVFKQYYHISPITFRKYINDEE